MVHSRRVGYKSLHVHWCNYCEKELKVHWSKCFKDNCSTYDLNMGI